MIRLSAAHGLARTSIKLLCATRRSKRTSANSIVPSLRQRATVRPTRASSRVARASPRTFAMSSTRLDASTTRRHVLLAVSATQVVPRRLARATEASTGAITHRVYVDFGLCPTLLRNERKLGDKSALCGADEVQSMGRVVLGLYGERAPRTVENFLAMVEEKDVSAGYRGSTVSKVKPGEYVLLGRQGSAKFGKVEKPKAKSNPETVSTEAFQLSHLRPGTLSLAIGANDDDARTKMSGGYRNVEFLITTGPGPALQLDGENLVFGRVLEGMQVIADIARVPRNTPSENVRKFNALATLLGDSRASGARNAWDSPLQSILITDCGILGNSQET